MVNYKKLLLSIIATEIENHYKVEVLDIRSADFENDSVDDDFTDFKIKAALEDLTDYRTRWYMVYGCVNSYDGSILFAKRRFLADI